MSQIVNCWKLYRTILGNAQSLPLNNIHVYFVSRQSKALKIFQYCYWKQMAKAATLIQNKYRLYCEHKRLKRSQQAASCIQNYYRNYKEHQDQNRNRNYAQKESTPTSGIK